jgi:antitoxin MazE
MYIRAGTNMKIKVAKWGNSLAVRLPKRLADDLGLRPGAVVDLSQDGSRLAIETAPRRKIPRYRLEDLLAEMDRLGPENAPKPEEYEILPSEWPEEDWSDIAPKDGVRGAKPNRGRGAKRGTTRRRRA